MNLIAKYLVFGPPPPKKINIIQPAPLQEPRGGGRGGGGLPLNVLCIINTFI